MFCSFVGRVVLASVLFGSMGCAEVDLSNVDMAPDATAARATVDNPYAYVGEAHNDYLGCLLEHDTAAVEEIIVLLALSCGYDSTAPELGLGDELDRLESTLYATGLGLGLDADSLDILDMADTIVQTMEPADALDSLESLESYAVIALGHDAEPVLAGLATARSSGEFWLAREAVSRPEREKRPKWWEVVLADAGGAVVGSIFGGPGGAVVLGSAASTAFANGAKAG